MRSSKRGATALAPRAHTCVIAGLLLAAGALAACGGRTSTQPSRSAQPAATQPDLWAPPPRPKPDAEWIFTRFAQFNDEVCKCSDNDCLERVTDARNRFATEMYDQYGESWVTPEQETRAAALQKAFLDCFGRIVKPEPNRPDSRELRVMAPISALRDRMCGCTDEACASAVKDDFVAFVKDVGHVPLEPDQKIRFRDLTMELTKCEWRTVARSRRAKHAP